ncbi:MAG: NUDIX domain-containing protein [Patescibacteria group bacterium]
MPEHRPEQRPGVGVGVFVIRDGKVLFGKRKSAHGEGTWAPPGGKLDMGETVVDCAARELKEETGLTVVRAERLPVYTEDFFEELHFITTYVLAETSGEPSVMESEKCEAWGWFPWDRKPEPLFLTIRNLDRQGYRPPGA